jgi:ComF family protein
VQEAVFSSTGFRIRAAQPTATIAPVGCWAKDVAASLFFTLFPADCRICSSPLLQVSRLPVCPNCLKLLHPLSSSLCARCGEALPYSISNDARIERECRICQLAEPPFERAVAYGAYDGALRDLVHLLKFDQVRPAAKPLGRLLAIVATKLEPSLPAGLIAVVPVPLFARKETQRGFNQADLIARAALKQVGSSVPGKRFELLDHTLVRTRNTGSQIGLTRHQRRENLRGAFKVANPTRVCGRNILLVDDVYTTGATASECTRVLLRAGAARVWVATVGRTIKVHDRPAIGDSDSVSEGEGEGFVRAEDQEVSA